MRESDSNRALIELVESRSQPNAQVLAAMKRVERHLYVPPEQLPDAYVDHALPIGYGQTISQPSLVAMMTTLLELDKQKRVLEIGTGSGYQTAILAELAGEVCTVERIPELYEESRKRLGRLGYENIRFLAGDGTTGWSKFAPYNAIIVTAGAPQTPPVLLEQLGVGGRMVIPLGPRTHQNLILIQKGAGEALKMTQHGSCLFVPLVGTEGWPEVEP